MARDKKVSVTITAKDRASKSILGLRSSLLSLKSLVITGLGFLGLNKVLKETVGRAQSAETGLKKLGVAMRAAGRSSEENLEFFKDLSVELERSTGILEEDVLQSLAVLQTFGQMSRADMEKTIVAAMDMSTVFGETLQQSAIRLGKAYNGNLRGLQMMGIGIDAATVKAKGFQAVLDQLAKEQGGQAIARMAGFEGAVNRVGVAYGEVGKELGRNITQSETFREVLEVVAGGFQIVAKWIKNKEEVDITASRATSGHRKELEKTKKTLADTGLVIMDNLLLSLKAEQLEKSIAKDRLDRAFREGKLSSNELALKLLGKQTKTERDSLALKKRLLALGIEIERLEKDKNIHGSKAHQLLLDEIEANKELERQYQADLKAGKERFAALVKEAEELRILLDRRKEVSDRKQAILDEEDDANAKSLAFEKRISDEKISLFKTALEQLEIIYKKDLEVAGNNAALKLDIEKIYAEKVRRVKQAISDEEDEIATAELGLAWSKMRKKADIIKQGLKDEAQAKKEFIAQALQEADAFADKEIAARQRVADRTANIQSSQVKEALRDENLNWSERNELIGEQEDKATSLFTKLTNGSIQTATELERAFNEFDKIKDTVTDVEGAENVLEILKETSNEIANLSDQFGRAKLTPDIDVQATLSKMRTVGERAADEFKKAFEAKLRSSPIDPTAGVKMSFTAPK